MKVQQIFTCGLCLLPMMWSQKLSATTSATFPRNYRQLTADNDLVRTLRGRLNLVSPLTVSELQPSVLTQPGDWTACIKVVSQGRLAPEPKEGLPEDRKPPAANPLVSPVLSPHDPRTVKYYAIFFRDGQIADSRPSVVIDHCKRLQYSPLPKASKPKAGSKTGG
jgi:hypothetical protein